jgi:hypothetical protein
MHVDLNKTEDDKGFLFYDTAENLQTYYRIEYALPASSRPSNRMLFMAKFLSDSAKNTPQLSRYTITVNAKEDFGRVQ